MKLVKEYLNEKFEEYSDPIQDLGIGLLPRNNLTSKQYSNSNSFKNCLNFDFFRAYRWGDNVFSPDEKQTHKILKLSQNNKQFFLENFGKQNFVFTYEYKQYAWAFTLPSNKIFVVFTGNKGTSYECSSYSLGENDQKRIIHFLDYLLSNIKIAGIV